MRTLFSAFPLPYFKKFMFVFDQAKAVRITKMSTSSLTIVTDSVLVDSLIAVLTISVSASSIPCFAVNSSLISCDVISSDEHYDEPTLVVLI